MSTDLPGLARLVEGFQSRESEYRAPSFDEASTRASFIDPFFEALGWDMYDHARLGAWRDVLRERSVWGDVAGRRVLLRPDYTFRLGGQPIMCVEAKRPGVDVDDPTYIHQVKAYAWNQKLSACVITNFADLRVYATLTPPVIHEPWRGAFPELRLSVDEYIDHLDTIVAFLSYDAVRDGALSRRAQEVDFTRPSLANQVDRRFLSDLERWRVRLAADIASNHPSLSVWQLAEASQRLLDRLVFLRTCEDRHIEPEPLLAPLRNGHNIKQRLDVILQPLDVQYNGTLFKSHFVDSLNVSDDTLRNIISALYPPESPYRLDVIDVEILGAAYERYLGSELVRTDGQIELRVKPELRKAEGIYYTPQWVVDEIIRLVVDPVVQGKNIRQLDAVRILDPACGSGSFLLAAFERLVHAYETYFTEHPGRRADNRHRDHYLASDGTRKLVSRAKGEILRRSIFGIDVDLQAVEVTMMSLYLKVLEGETSESIANERAAQYELFMGAVLPSLDDNIISGNTLVGSDAFQQELHELDTDELRRLNPMDWQSTGLAGPLATGGWDAVIGNPPYFSVDATYGRMHPMLRYLQRAYPSVWQDKSDILYYFLAKAVSVTRHGVGFIVSRAFLEAYKASALRKYLAQHATLVEVVDFQGFSVFPDAGIATAIVAFDKTNSTTRTHVRKLMSETAPALEKVVASLREGAAPFESFTTPLQQESTPWHFHHTDDRVLVEAIDASGTRLSNLATVGQGMQTGENNVFGELTWRAIEEMGVPVNLLARRIRNSDIRRGYLIERDEWLLYLEDIERFDLLPSQVQDYLNAHRAELAGRAAFRRGNCEWWKYTWPLHKDLYNRPRLVCPYRASYNRFAVVRDRGSLSLTDSTVVFPRDVTTLTYLLGVLNSRLLTFRFRRLGKLTGENMWEYFWNGVEGLPIVPVTSVAGARYRTDIERLVGEKVVYRRTLYQSPEGSADAVMAARRLAEADRQIDDVVLDLYGISDLSDRAVVHDIAIDDV